MPASIFPNLLDPRGEVAAAHSYWFRNRGAGVAFLAGALLLVAAACSGGGASPGGAGTGGTGGTSNGGSGGSTGALGYAPCPLATRVGGFVVTLANDSTGVEGRVRDGVVPGESWATDMEVGDCRVLKGPNLFCTPACSGATTCGGSGSCVPVPTPKNIGAVTVTGLLAPVTMTPSVVNSYADTGTLPHPGFTDGAAIALHAAGGDYPAFELRGQGIAALVVPAGDILVEPNKGLALTWTPPAQAGPARVHVTLDIAQHGDTSAELSCDVADTGSFQIPAALITRLIDIGVAGFPTLSLSRRTADSKTLAPGCVDLMIASTRDRDVKVAGVVSCNDEMPCPGGGVCQPNFTCP